MQMPLESTTTDRGTSGGSGGSSSDGSSGYREVGVAHLIMQTPDVRSLVQARQVGSQEGGGTGDGECICLGHIRMMIQQDQRGSRGISISPEPLALALPINEAD
ncbi:hypothetical protein M0804_004126 [Polistes exclamans]|nr:hypothetical protein M0804_004126 [Polistes exclamans]